MNQRPTPLDLLETVLNQWLSGAKLSVQAVTELGVYIAEERQKLAQSQPAQAPAPVAEA